MGLFTSAIAFLKGEEGGNGEDALQGLNDIHQQMVREYAESEGMTLKQAREHLHL